MVLEPLLARLPFGTKPLVARDQRGSRERPFIRVGRACRRPAPALAIILAHPERLLGIGIIVADDGAAERITGLVHIKGQRCEMVAWPGLARLPRIKRASLPVRAARTFRHGGRTDAHDSGERDQVNSTHAAQPMAAGGSPQPRYQPQSSIAQPRAVARRRSLPCGFTAT